MARSGRCRTTHARVGGRGQPGPLEMSQQQR
jgi:hypothetical protein